MREYWGHLNRTLHKKSSSNNNHCHIVTNLPLHKLGPLFSNQSEQTDEKILYFLDEYERRTGIRISRDFQVQIYTLNDILNWQAMDNLTTRFTMKNLGISREPIEEIIHNMVAGLFHKRITVITLEFFDQLNLIKSQHLKVRIVNDALWIGDPLIKDHDCFI